MNSHETTTICTQYVYTIHIHSRTRIHLTRQDDSPSARHEYDGRVSKHHTYEYIGARWFVTTTTATITTTQIHIHNQLTTTTIIHYEVRLYEDRKDVLLPNRRVLA